MKASEASQLLNPCIRGRKRTRVEYGSCFNRMDSQGVDVLIAWVENEWKAIGLEMHRITKIEPTEDTF